MSDERSEEGIGSTVLLGDLFRDHFETSDESQLDPKRSGDARMENLHRCEIGQLVLLFQRKRLAEIVNRLNAIAKKNGLKTHSETLEHLLDESDKK